MAASESAFLPAAASAADVEQFRSEVEALEAEQSEETWRRREGTQLAVS